MRTFLLFLGWVSLVGSLFDGAIAAFLAWLIVAGEALIDISVDMHLKDHLSFVYWVKGVAYMLFPETFVDWLFALPAMIYFPVRVAVSIVIGAWLLQMARRMRPVKTRGSARPT